MPFLPVIAFLVLSQDLKETYGKTNAQILAMGRSGWIDFYTGREGGATTMAMAGAESLYGDALGWRNDKFGKAKIGKLRVLLQATARDSCEVGTAVTGGGTMWNIIGASLMTDGEETLYSVLSGKGTGPKHVVSDMEKAFTRLKKDLQDSDSTPEMKKMGRDSVVLLRKDLNRVIEEAARRPRRQSDALLEFCIKAMSASRN